MTVSAQMIEKDLADLWKSESGDKTKNPGLQRVYTTNLVAYALPTIKKGTGRSRS